MELTETAYAKINLALHVRRRRPDDYHDLETLFAFAEDGDRLTARPAAAFSLTIGGAFGAGLSAGEENLVLRAARATAAALGVGDALGFALDKRLPVAAGIGGGSADAAAAVRLIARRHGVGLDDPRLLEVARGLGADVPACLESVAVRGEGRGDVLARLGASLAGIPLLLVNPRVPLATGAVFAGWDGIDRGALADGDPLAAALAGRNDLEPPARALLPEIGAALERLAAQPGVRLARMSGSGGTCFALFDDAHARDAAAGAITAAEPGWWVLATRLR